MASLLAGDGQLSQLAKLWSVCLSVCLSTMPCVLQGSSVEQEGEKQPAVEEGKEKEKAENLPEPLWQLITAFSRSATTEATFLLEADFLYISYATIMGQVCTVYCVRRPHRCKNFLWPPYVIGQAIIFLPCGFYLSFFFYLFSSPNLSGRRLDVYNTSTHGVALVQI